MFFKQWLHSSIVRFGLIALVMVLGAFISARSTEVALAAPSQSILQQEAQPQAAQAVPAQMQGVYVTCHPERVAAYAERIHVKCTEAYNGITFFALSTVEGRHVARVLSVLLTAHATGKTLNILYEPNDTGGSSFGCGVENCRVILMAEMVG